MSELKTKGKFWPYIRPLIWEKAQELYQMENAKTMKNDFKGLTATRKELREGGYFHTAKLIILHQIWQQKNTYQPPNKKPLQKNPYCHLKTRKHKIINVKGADKENGKTKKDKQKGR